MKKRLLAVLLCLCMVTVLLPVSTLALTEESAGSASYGEMLNPTANPGEDWENDETNPYGTNEDQPFALNPVNELLLYKNRGNNAWVYKDNFDKGAGTLHDNSYYVAPHTVTDGSGTGRGIKTAGYVSGVAFDPNGTGRADHAAYVGFATAPSGTIRFVYWVQDLVTGESSEFTYLGEQPGDHPWVNNLTQYQVKNFISLTAGDYDGDGKETVFITYPGSSAIYQMKQPNANGIIPSPYYDNFITDGSFAPAAGNNSSTAAMTDQLSISLATGDFDKDGVDELAVSAGLCYTSDITDLNGLSAAQKYVTSLSLFDFKKASGSAKLEPVVFSQVNKRLLMTYDPSKDEVDSQFGIITSKYYNTIRYAGIAAGDVNGDGYDDVVAAGYLGSVKQYTAEVSGNKLDQSTVYGSVSKKVAYAVCYGASNTVTEVQTMDMNRYTSEGMYGVNKIIPQFTVVCASLDGYGTADYAFIMGSVYSFNTSGGASLAITTDRGLLKGGRDGAYWYDTAVAGNFDGNAAGREQIVAVAYEKQLSYQDYDCYVDTIGGYYYNDTTDSNGKPIYGSMESLYTSPRNGGNVVTDASSSFSTDTAEQFSCLVLSTDVDTDGLLVKYMTKGYGYSDAQVQAVLQAAPYFGELGDYDQDFSDGSTTYSISSGYTNTSSRSDSVSFGFSLMTEHEFVFYKFAVSVGVTVDWTQTYEKSLSVEYSSEFSASGDDTVVLYRVPATTYYYAVCNPETGEFEYDGKNVMATVVPEAPVYTTMDKATYNKFVTEYNTLHAKDIKAGGAKALPYITSEVLPENATGDPFAYWRDYGVVKDADANTTGTVSGFTTLSDNLKQLGIGSGSISSGWTSASEYSEGTETSVGFAVSTSHQWGKDKHWGGFEVEFGYSHATGTVYTTMESRGASGTVNSLDQRALLNSYGIPYAVTDQYDFKWDFGMRTWSLSDALNAQKIPVFGYVLTGVRAAPPVPLNLAAQVKALDTVALEWSEPAATARAYDGYNVWCAKNGGEYVKVNTDLLGTDITSYTVTGLDSNTKYSFVVSTQLATTSSEGEPGTVDGSFSQPAEATTPKKNYTVTYTGSNADISASYLGDIAINSGASVAEESIVFVTATPKIGYTITGVTLTTPTGTENVALVGGKFNFILRGDTTIQVTTAAIAETSELTFTQPADGGSFTASVGGGAVTGNKVTVVDPVELSAAPDSGYVLKEWLVDGKPIQALGSNTMTFTPYQDTHTISAMFVEKNDPEVNVALTVNTGNGGKLEITDASGAVLTPNSGSLSLLMGTEITVTAKPNNYYSLLNWTGALSDYSKNTQSVTLSVTEAMTVGAEFYAPIQYPVSFSAGANGTLTAAMNGAAISGAKTNVVPGSSISFTANAENGYRISGWTVTGFGEQTVSYANRLVTSDVLNLDNITSSSTVRVNFTPIKTCTITFDPGAGTGTPYTAQTSELTEYTLPANTFTPPDSMVFRCWQIGQRTYSAGDKCVFDGDTTVTALWRSPANSAGGGAAPAGTTVPVNSEFGKTEFSATVSGSTAVVSVTDQQLSTVISQAEKTGLIHLELSGLKVSEATIPAKLVEAAIQAAGASGLQLSFAWGTVTLDLATLKPLKGKDIVVSVTRVTPDSLTAEQKDFLGKQLDTAVIVDIKLQADNVTVSDLGGGTVSVQLPYTPKDGEDTSKLVVLYVKDDGTLESHATSYNAETNMVTFATGHLSQYLLASFPFEDVSDSSYAYPAVVWAVNNSITSGKTDTTFSPDDTCTRAQTVTFLWRSMGSPEPTATNCPFTDVKADAYYYKAVLWATEKGITKGTSATTFSPESTVTRAQVVTFQYRTANSPTAGAQNPFIDVSDSAYYISAVLWAVNEKITQGTTATTFSPEDPCTRAQIVTFLWRQLGK